MNFLKKLFWSKHTSKGKPIESNQLPINIDRKEITTGEDNDPVLIGLKNLLERIRSLKKSSDDYDTEMCIIVAQMLIQFFPEKDTENKYIIQSIDDIKKNKVLPLIASQRNTQQGKLLKEMYKILYPNEII